MTIFIKLFKAPLTEVSIGTNKILFIMNDFYFLIYILKKFNCLTKKIKIPFNLLNYILEIKS